MSESAIHREIFGLRSCIMSWWDQSGGSQIGRPLAGYAHRRMGISPATVVFPVPLTAAQHDPGARPSPSLRRAPAVRPRRTCPAPHPQQAQEPQCHDAPDVGRPRACARLVRERALALVTLAVGRAMDRSLTFSLLGSP
jgi:hypothetical protein